MRMRMRMKSLKVMMFVMFVVCVVLKVGYGEHQTTCLPKEREALLQFKAAIVDRYGMLSSWSTPHCCQWQGIHCSNLTAHILGLHLPRVYAEYDQFSRRCISGEIHQSLMELQQLEYLNLSSNSFGYKRIPDFLGSLTNLRYLDLSSCDFTGEISSQLGSLSHLKYLNLAGNFLYGSIPPQLGNLFRLQHLDLRGNNLEGNIPSQLGNLSQLQHLDLRANYLEGNIPSQLGNLSQLQELYLGGYDGPLKIEDGGQWLSNLISLTHLSLDSVLNRSHSWLQGIAKLPKLRELILINCGLSDHFLLSSRPFEFNFSTSLSLLDLSCNTFTSPMIFEWVSNFTTNLVELNLGGNLLEGSTSNHFGLAMNLLQHLYLYHNVLKGEDLKSFMNICTLRSLDMSVNNMTEDLPSILRSLSNGCVRYSLQELSLASNQITGSIADLSVLSSLKTLDLSTNQLSGKIPEGTKLPSQLEHLSISYNSLEGGVPKSFGSTCTLQSLDLSSNKLSEDLILIFNHLSGCSRNSLRELSLGLNKFNGTLPDFSMFSKLEMLDLSGNRLRDGVPKSLHNGTVFRFLDLSNNSLSEKLPTIIHHLFRYARYSLQHLDLSMNQIIGTLPNILSMFPSLKALYLDRNKLNGTISKDFRFPTELEGLDLSSNSLKGVIRDSHFYNMSKLTILRLSDNSFVVQISQNWAPSFQLVSIDLRSCMLGPLFPKWLEKQNEFHRLDISNNEISDTVPKWFWAKFELRAWIRIDISCNNLQGMIPDLSLESHLYSLNLGTNQFEGHIPSFLRSSMFLDLSTNKFTDSFLFLCSSGVVETLYQLDLSNNKFTGQIPDCWTHFKSLTYLNMSQNNFSGKIPNSMGSLLKLQVLLLRNNNLTGELSSSLRNCTKLVMLDMAKNRLSGSIPDWIGSKLLELQILSLGNNYFYGSLPLQICYLKNIQLLDLSLNNLSGKIPKCIKNFFSMSQAISLRDDQVHLYFVNTSYAKGSHVYNLNALLMWKGSEKMFTNDGLSLLKSIDLSSNQFSGEIPKEIEDLFGLISLNLSRNYLTGKIPSNIGELTSLESLDMSRNQLVGSIPLSLAQIDRLAVLDLSHNYLSGKIPTSTQLQSFDTSKYEGNVDLCGPPLKKCIDSLPRQEAIVKIHEDDNLIFSCGFYISMTIGFVMSFWGVFGSILIIRSWRHTYFKFLSNLADTLYIMAATKVFK